MVGCHVTHIHYTSCMIKVPNFLDTSFKCFCAMLEFNQFQQQQETRKLIVLSKQCIDPLAKFFAHLSIYIHPNHSPRQRPWCKLHVPLLYMLVVVWLINLFIITVWAPLPFDGTCLLASLFLPISLPYKLIIKLLSTGVSFKTMHPVSHMITSLANKYSRKMSDFGGKLENFVRVGSSRVSGSARRILNPT